MQLKKQGIHILGVNYKDNPEKAIAWLNNFGDPYAMIVEDRDGRFAIDLGVYGTPETFLLDKQGRIQYRHIGILNETVWKKDFLPRLKELNKSDAHV
jgi:cytochrome c biogenesis protein CcmG/thiol:disulfide interchange protein DsbE